MAAASLPHVLQAVTPEMCWAHYHVRAEDQLFFLGDYDPGTGYAGGGVNNLISNLKKKPNLRHTTQWPHKLAAISKSAAALNATCQHLCNHIWVPIPPSKTRDHELYDDRLEAVLRETRLPGRLDVRSLITQRTSTEAAHTSGENRPKVEDLIENYDFHSDLLHPTNSRFVLFDDVLTSGSHFRACERLILGWKPDAEIIGVFLAKVKRPSPFEDFEFESPF